MLRRDLAGRALVDADVRDVEHVDGAVDEDDPGALAEQPRVVAVVGAQVGRLAGDEDHPVDAALEEHLHVLGLGDGGPADVAEDRREARLRRLRLHRLGERGEDRVGELGDEQADRAGPRRAGRDVQQVAHRALDALARLGAHARRPRDDARGRGQADACPLGDVAEGRHFISVRGHTHGDVTPLLRVSQAGIRISPRDHSRSARLTGGAARLTVGQLFHGYETHFKQASGRAQSCPGKGGTLLMKITKWRAAGLALVTTALVAAVALSTASARVHATNLVIWTDANRAPAVTQLANAWASANGATVKVVSKDFGSIRSSLGTVAAADAPDVVLAAHDWTGRARRQRPRAAAVSVGGGQGAVPEVHARRVLVRHRGQEALRHPGAGREHRAAREHEARPEDSDDVRAARVDGAGPQEEEPPRLRHLRPAGLRRRRVPHVPVLLGPRRLRVRREQGRQPRPVGHRSRQPGVPEEREADRQVEQGRPDQLEDRLLDVQQRLPEGPGRRTG